jgi:AraC-like DNA-binding protein
MIYQKHIPRFPLVNYIDSIIYIEGNNKGTGLPKTAMSLVFNLEDNFKLFTDKAFTKYIDYEKYWVAGLQTQPTNVESYGKSKMLVVQFKTLGAFVILNDPLHYYTDNYITLDNIFKKEADETWEQLQEAQSLNEKFLIVENFLYRKLLTNKLPNKKFISTIGILLDNRKIISINEICKKFNVSRKHLNNLSKDYVGVSPKMLSSLNRLQTTLKTISSLKSDRLIHVAYELDYFDQAHFNNDFKRFTNLKPTEYVNFVEQNPSMKIVPHFIPFL